jgi:hypothetical protein
MVGFFCLFPVLEDLNLLAQQISLINTPNHILNFWFLEGDILEAMAST